MRDKSPDGFCNQDAIMEQLSNHDGGLDKLVKARWDRYDPFLPSFISSI
jgi:hypothetical protein